MSNMPIQKSAITAITVARWLGGMSSNPRYFQAGVLPSFHSIPGSKHSQNRSFIVILSRVLPAVSAETHGDIGEAPKELDGLLLSRPFEPHALLPGRSESRPRRACSVLSLFFPP